MLFDQSFSQNNFNSVILTKSEHYTCGYTVDICRYENLESLGKCFVPFFHTHLPSAFQGITFKCAR